jgi:hypothetical protein
MLMLQRRHDVTTLLFDAAGLAVSCGLLMFASFGWIVSFLLVLRKWLKYGRAQLQSSDKPPMK